MSYSLISKKTVAAKKRRSCIWCGETINVGDKYVREFSKFYGDTQNHCWHPECEIAANEYFASGEGPEFSAYENERPNAQSHRAAEGGRG